MFSTRGHRGSGDTVGIHTDRDSAVVDSLHIFNPLRLANGKLNFYEQKEPRGRASAVGKRKPQNKKVILNASGSNACKRKLDESTKSPTLTSTKVQPNCTSGKPHNSDSSQLQLSQPIGTPKEKRVFHISGDDPASRAVHDEPLSNLAEAPNKLHPAIISDIQANHKLSMPQDQQFSQVQALGDLLSATGGNWSAVKAEVDNWLHILGSQPGFSLSSRPLADSDPLRIFARQDINKFHDPAQLFTSMTQKAELRVDNKSTRVVALKRVPLATAHGPSYETMVAQFTDDTKRIHDARGHLNCVQLIGICNDPPALLWEYCNAGTLRSHLYYMDESGKLVSQQVDVAMRLLICHQVIAAVAHLHSKGIYHGNISSSSFLMTKRNGLLCVKLSSYGMTRRAGQSEPYYDISELPVHPDRWRAKEELEYSCNFMNVGVELTNEDREAADVYSLGCVLGEILFGVPPFYKYATLTDMKPAKMRWSNPFAGTSNATGLTDTQQSAGLHLVGICTRRVGIKARVGIVQLRDEEWPEFLYQMMR